MVTYKPSLFPREDREGGGSGGKGRGEEAGKSRDYLAHFRCVLGAFLKVVETNPESTSGATLHM